MKIVKLFAAVLCVVVLCTSLSSCGARLFFDEDGNFVGLDNILTAIYGDEVIDVERIEITNEGLKHSESWGKYIVISPNDKGERKFQIDYRVYPDNATNTAVDYSYSASPEGCATVDEQGVVTFTSSGMIKVYVIATDGSNAEATLTIISR